jgi:hypothetical protein
MASHSCSPVEGERYDPKYPRDYPASPSRLQPLPYYPNLKRALRSVTGALVFTYIELLHPPQQDSSGTFLSGPITLHLDQISEDLQITRRTLFTSICILAARWRDEEARGRAARGRREFLNPIHTIHARWKLYSITGATSYVPHTIVQLRRNLPAIANLLRNAGITSLSQQEFPGMDQFEKLTAAAESASTQSILVQKESLAGILLRASTLSVDRRTLRYPRLRSAVAAGLVPPAMLHLRRHSGNQ